MNAQVLITQQLDLIGKPLHPLPCFPREVEYRPDTLLDGHPFFPGDQVVGVRDDLLFRRAGHAVAGRQSQERTFVGSKTRPGVAFHDTGNVLTQTSRADYIGPALGVADIMGPAPADIVEPGALFNEMKIDIGIVCCIIAGTVPHCPAMGNDFCAAPGIAQQVFAFFSRWIRHGQATS
jgi:hypothetical protein